MSRSPTRRVCLRTLACSLAVALAACGNARALDPCKADVDELMVFLRAMDHTGDVARPLDGEDLQLVLRPEAKRNEQYGMPVVILTPGKTRREGLKDRDPRLVALAIDRRVPWSEVAAAIASLEGEGRDHVLLVFEALSPVAPPPRVAIDDTLDEIFGVDYTHRVQRIGVMAQDLGHDCHELDAAYRATLDNVAVDRATSIIEGVGEGLVECDCHADLPSLRSFLWRLVGNPHPQRIVEITLDSDGRKVSAPAGTPWVDVAPRIYDGQAIAFSVQSTGQSR